MTVDPSLLERAIRRDKPILLAAILAIAGLSWLYLFHAAAAMKTAAAEAAMHAAMGMTMPGMATSGAAEFADLWLMWTVMMVAMMLPSAAPLALLVLGTYRHRTEHRARLASGAFVAGYLLIWTGFSGLAALTQVWLRRAALLSPEMASSSHVLAGVLLIATGLYQWLPLKGACLSRCRSPIDFLMRHWREGLYGAVSMGMRHGLFCLGCCWALMALLFVAGVMNLLWIAIIAAFVLVEKLVRTGTIVSRVAGAGLLAWGGWVLLS